MMPTKTERDQLDKELLPDGQQRDHLVLPENVRNVDENRVRPVRRSYVHAKCGGKTTMGEAIAETYAANPGFYSATFCCACGGYFPVGKDGEFTWYGSDEKVGT